MGTKPDFAVVRYTPSKDVATPWRDWTSCADAINNAFRFSPAAGSLRVGLPEGFELPLCGNTRFRAFAKDLLTKLPGLPIFVFGGSSAIASELILGAIPNLRATMDARGEVTVTYPALEAQTYFHGQFQGMLTAGINEDDALRELTLLSQKLGMTEMLWA